MRRSSTSTVIGAVATIMLALAAMSPLTTAVAAAQSEAGLTGDQSYTSPQFGYEATWDDPWSADERATRSRADREDRLVLIDDDSDAELAIRGRFTEEAPGDVVEELIADREDDEEDVTVEDQRQRAGRASALVSYAGRDGDVVEYVEVTEIDADESVLVVDVVVPAGDFAAALDALTAVEIDGDAVFQDEPVPPDATVDDDPTETPADEGTVRRRPNFPTGDPTEEPTEEPTETAGGGEGVDGDTFTSPNFDFSFSWDEDVWSVGDTSIDDDREQISLEARDSNLFFQAESTFNGDVEECLSTVTEVLSEGEADFEIEDVDVLEDGDGDPIEDSSPDRAFVANLYTATVDGEEQAFVYYVECRTLVEDESELVILHLVLDPDDYADEAEAREEILDTLETDPGSQRDADPTTTSEADDPTATPDEDETPVAGDATTYESDAFGFSLAYDPEIWEEAGSGDDGIALDDGPSSLTVAAAEEYEGDAVACVQGQLELIRGSDGVTGIEAETGANGRRVSGGDSERFYALYRVTASDGTFDGTNELLVYLECRTLVENDSVLTITQIIFDPDQYEQEAERAEEVLETIEIDN